MKKFSIRLLVEDSFFDADVLATDHGDFTEYHVTPSDPQLKVRYGTQSVAGYPNRPFESHMFTPDEASEAYKRAMLEGLERHLAAGSQDAGSQSDAAS
ncbi:MAG: hypothetical protein Q8938_14110 [Bacteroidota bacterium]|nr:hypothetical protein [Bacteroidota bacterium]